MSKMSIIKRLKVFAVGDSQQPSYLGMHSCSPTMGDAVRNFIAIFGVGFIVELSVTVPSGQLPTILNLYESAMTSAVTTIAILGYNTYQKRKQQEKQNNAVA